MKSLDERLKIEISKEIAKIYFKWFEGLTKEQDAELFDALQTSHMNVANKLKELLSGGITFEKIPVYKRPYSNEISHYSYNEEAILAAQLKIAELEHKIKELEQQAASDKELNRQLANRNADLKTQLDKAEIVILKIKNRRIENPNQEMVLHIDLLAKEYDAKISELQTALKVSEARLEKATNLIKQFHPEDFAYERKRAEKLVGLAKDFAQNGLSWNMSRVSLFQADLAKALSEYEGEK